jgi:hypothetical protein
LRSFCQCQHFRLCNSRLLASTSCSSNNVGTIRRFDVYVQPLSTSIQGLLSQVATVSYKFDRSTTSTRHVRFQAFALKPNFTAALLFSFSQPKLAILSDNQP